MSHRHLQRHAAMVVAFLVFAASLRAQTLERAFIFGSRNLACETPNQPGTNYTVVFHEADSAATVEALRYDEDRGWGYEILYSLTGAGDLPPGVTPPDNVDDLPAAPVTSVGDFQIFGPFDNSPNGRAVFPDTCPEQIYDSFIGAKNFTNVCTALEVGDTETPCAEAGIPPQGLVFRVDLPNGKYRFVAAVGSADNSHVSRILAEDGGEGPPENIGPNHVVLVSNFDQSEHCTGTFARVGFGCYIPPTGSGPAFVNMDEDGLYSGDPADPATSPTLEVTQGYIRIHQLQGNSNAGTCGGPDPNGGNMVLLELWEVGDEVIPDGDFSTATVTRTIDPASAAPGEDITVTLTPAGVDGPTTIVETIPPGAVISGAGDIDPVENTITIEVNDNSPVQYTVQTPDSCGSFVITGTVSREGACPLPGVSGQASVACLSTDSALSADGGVLAQLVIGPIDLSNGGLVLTDRSGICDDGGNLATTDYLFDGANGEVDVLVGEGDEIEPLFQPANPTGGYGVAQGENLFINPNAVDGILEVFVADADQQGYINYNDADNLGDATDALNDYIVYSLVYLVNESDSCRQVVLEVGSDDGVKVILNGALVHVNGGCRGIPAYGTGDRVPVALFPGKNACLIGVVERGGGTGVRLVVRDTDDLPITDGSVTTSLEPPAAFPGGAAGQVTRAIPNGGYHDRGAEVEVTLTATNLPGETVITETIPAGFEIVAAAGADVDDVNGTITYTLQADGEVSYTIRAPDDRCDCSNTISGLASSTDGCYVTGVLGDSRLICAVLSTNVCDPPADAADAELVWAGYFGANTLTNGVEPCFSPNDDGVELIPVIQTDALSLAYDEDRGWGYEVMYDPGLSPYGDRNGYGVFGPLDDSPNSRGQLGGGGNLDCVLDFYASFIGGKDFLFTWDATINDPADGTVPCALGNLAPLAPDGIVFRIDLDEPGNYRFVGAFGDVDNVHAHRILVEDGGEGPPALPDDMNEHVVLVDNFDQAQQAVGTVTAAEPGEGVFARVGFDGYLPPQPADLDDLPDPKPYFVNMDENGKATFDCPNSPTLEVTEDYIRIHQLQGNSNDGCGGPRDPNGGDMIYFEVWRVGTGPTPTGFKRGDTDGSGVLDISDPIFNLTFQFVGGIASLPCADAADVDNSGLLDISDPIYNLTFQFVGGIAPPPAPGPTSCGPDDDADTLDCVAYPQEKC